MTYYQDNFSCKNDLRETYRSILEDSNAFRAWAWYWIQTLLTLKYYISLTTTGTIAMYKNYLKIAFRNIKRNLMHSFINIAGLGIGLAASLLILLWVNDELSYDQFHENADTVYRVNENWYNSNGTKSLGPRTPYPLGAAMVNNYPEIKRSLHYYGKGEYLISNGENSFYENRFCFADSIFFDVFSFPLVSGDPTSVLDDPKSVVISESMAEKYFGNENPIGRVLQLNTTEGEFTITGIMKDSPQNSHLQFDFVANFAYMVAKGESLKWWHHNFWTYIQLEEGVDAAALDKKIRTYLNDFDPNPGPPRIDLHLHALKDIYLRSNVEGGSYRIIYSYIFSFVAVIVLVVACINFMNLATAQSVNRAKEIGLRKVVGAYKKHIIKQYLIESMILTLLALSFALIAVYAFLPEFNQITGKSMNMLFFGSGKIILSIILITALTGLFASSYPALYLSSFNPLNIIKGKHKSGKGSINFRRILVVAQFTLSTILLIGIFIISEQVDYMRNKNIGINKENIIYFRSRGSLLSSYESFKAELLKHPEIKNVTKSSSTPMIKMSGTTAIEWEGQPEGYTVLWGHSTVDFDYIETFGLKLIQGRNFSRDITTDALNGYIINEAGAKVMGFENPVGKMFNQWRNKGTIIGVVKDFHFKSLHQEITPLVMHINPLGGTFASVFVKIRSENTLKVIEQIKEITGKFEPAFPCEIHFVEEDVDMQYLSEVRIGKMFRYFSILGIFISCLGLFGLSSFIAEQRTKEIGIRKVLGATKAGLIGLLSAEFVKWILLANVIAWPIGWYIMRNWLEQFPYRTDMHISVFFLSGILTLLITLLTVSIHTNKASRANPVESLRNE